MSTSSILVIYTGGTIGMKQDPADGTLKPFDFSQIKDEVPELNKFGVRIDSHTFDPLIDSSDVEPSLWVALAQIIRDRYEEYDGFVILHGTDTMAYSASALSFMLEGLTKPVIFTGSQLPIGVPRTDGKENLIGAVEIAAAKDADGHAKVPEVCIFFDSRLLRGNRATKYSAEAFNAFLSPDCPPLAEAELAAFSGLANSEYHKAVARLIDSRINPAYKLYPNNYIAHDIRYGSKKFRGFYTQEEYDAFKERLAKLDRYDTCDLDQLKDIFLGIYANPVENRE